jgi:hypothetical protein
MNTKITYVGKVESKDWPHFLWIVNINGFTFEYKTGVGLAKSGKPIVPKEDHVLHALFCDAQASEESFSNFCGDFGYAYDSISAFNTYMACFRTAELLKSAFGTKYTEIKEKYLEIDI